MNTTLTAVEGLEVGHYTDLGNATGCTVVICRQGAVGGVDVRGGSPGTRETDLLHPGRRVDRVLETTLTFRPTHFHVANGDVRISATLVDVDADSGHATSIRRIVVDESNAERLALNHEVDEVSDSA